MRQTVKIPEAGKKLVVDMTGRSLVIEEMPVYSDVDDQPILNFSPGVNGYPLYPRSTYPNSGEFKKVEIIGTAAAAGDEITIFSTDQCLDFSININFGTTDLKECGVTFVKVATDAAQGFSDLELQNAEGKMPTSIYVHARLNDIGYAFDTDPDQAGFANVLAAPKKKARGGVHVSAAPAADETFDITIFGETVSVTALATDTPAQIAVKVRDALNGSTEISQIAKAYINSADNRQVILETLNFTDAFNGEDFSTTAADTDLKFYHVDGGSDKVSNPLEVKGIDFIKKFRFIDLAGTGQFTDVKGQIIITGEY